MEVKRNLFLRAALMLLACLFAGPSRAASGTVEKQTDGAYVLTGTDYVARVSTGGMLESLQVGGAELFAQPLLYGNTNWKQLTQNLWRIAKTEQPAPNSLKLTLAIGPRNKPYLLATYTAEADSLRVTLQRVQDQWGGNVGWRVGPHVLAVEPLARPGFGYKRLPGNGLVYALPVAEMEAVRDVRYYLDNHRALDATYLLNDAPYNRQSSGDLLDDGWGRGLMDNRPLELIFTPVSAPKTADAAPKAVNAAQTPLSKDPNAAPRLRALPVYLQRGLSYKLVSDAPQGMFPAGKPAGFRLLFRGPVATSAAQILAYRLLDFDGGEAERGTRTVTPQNLKENVFAFTISPKQTGWYRLVASLRPATDPSALPSEGDAEFGVFTPKPDLVNPPLKPESLPGVTGALGLRCVRLALYLNQFFPARENSPVGNQKYDWRPLDEQINPFFADCKRYEMTGFCLLNGRPQWTDSRSFATLMQAIADRYKAVNHRWEIENEPQDRYTPENYVTQALAPAFRGAHAADPDAQIMGPTIVRVDLNWFERFFAADGGKFLDILSTHSYTGHNRSWEEHGNADDFRALRDLMKKHGVGEKPIWQTEEGFIFDTHAEMPRLHAAYVVRMFALGASVGVPTAHNSYFYAAYNGFEPWYLYAGVPNRSGMATRIFSEQTDGMTFEREMTMGKYAHALVFSNGKQDTVACWLDDFSAAARFKFNPAMKPQIADIMGRSVPMQGAKPGLLTLTLDGFPRYIRLPHGANLQPLDRFPDGANLAAAANGATASASSFAGPPTDAGNLNDGTWHFDDGQTAQKIWVGKPDAPMPQWAQVKFAAPRRIDTIVAVTPSANVGLPGPRHYQLQYQANGAWKTVREGRDNTMEWVLYSHFPPVTATAVRVVFLELNNGWWRQDKAKFSDMASRIYELEAYGR